MTDEEKEFEKKCESFFSIAGPKIVKIINDDMPKFESTSIRFEIMMTRMSRLIASIFIYETTNQLESGALDYVLEQVTKEAKRYYLHCYKI